VSDPSSYDQILQRLAPCGIDCERCVMRTGGVVQRAAARLADAVEGFDGMAARMAEHVPPLGGYDRFREVLGVFAGAPCAGCRAGGSTLPFCAARTCFKEQGVDFCFQCSLYPCDRNGYPDPFAQTWRKNQDRMREVGVERFYEESLRKPRYR
jgi:hypothetical protein